MEPRIRLKPEMQSARAARGFVDRSLRGWDSVARGAAVLLVDELVVNAVQHAGTLVEVRLVRQPDAVEVAVRDGTPVCRIFRRDPHEERGRRLLTVDARAEAWRGSGAARQGGVVSPGRDINRGNAANPAEVRNARQLRSPSTADMITISIDPTVMRLTPRLRKSASHRPSRSGPDARRPEKPRITNAIPRLSRFSGFARNHARTLATPFAIRVVRYQRADHSRAVSAHAAARRHRPRDRPGADSPIPTMWARDAHRVPVRKAGGHD
jgi:hypothetical protein